MLLLVFSEQRTTSIAPQLSSRGVCKLWPVGLIWLTAYFHMDYELSRVLTVLNV